VWEVSTLVVTLEFWKRSVTVSALSRRELGTHAAGLGFLVFQKYSVTVLALAWRVAGIWHSRGGAEISETFGKGVGAGVAGTWHSRACGFRRFLADLGRFSVSILTAEGGRELQSSFQKPMLKSSKIMKRMSKGPRNVSKIEKTMPGTLWAASWKQVVSWNVKNCSHAASCSSWLVFRINFDSEGVKNRER
jgi:hypothetical protein